MNIVSKPSGSPLLAAAALILFAAGACAVDSVAPSAPRAPGDVGTNGGSSASAGNSNAGGATGGANGGGNGGGGSATAGPVSDASAPVFDAGTGTGVLPQDAECDLRGRWLVAQRVLATAIGQDQAAHNWFYLEVRHEGAEVTLLKGLHCGYEVIKKTALSAAVNSSGAWPAILSRNSSAGRKGKFVKEGAGCRLSLAKEYVVRGATIAHYSNPANPMPTKDQKAVGTTPGWEDWDGDNNPGISLKVDSSLASGTLYVAQRDWTQYDGITPLGATKFQVAITYGGVQVPLGRSAGASQAIETASSPSSDPKQHFAWFAKLDDTQATGSDSEICAAVRTLRNSLTPDANQ